MTKRAVFLSYPARIAADSELGVLTSRQLRATGIDVVDGTSVAAKDVDAAIARADAFVACFSANGYVERDLRIALREAAANDRDWLIAVRLTRCDIPPLPTAHGKTLRDCVMDLDEVISLLQPRRRGNQIRSEVRSEQVFGQRIDVRGVRIKGDPNASINTTTDIKTATGDESVTIIGADVDATRTSGRD